MNTLPDSVHILPEPNFNLFCKKSLKDQLRISEYKYLSSRIKLFLNYDGIEIKCHYIVHRFTGRLVLGLLIKI